MTADEEISSYMVYDIEYAVYHISPKRIHTKVKILRKISDFVSRSILSLGRVGQTLRSSAVGPNRKGLVQWVAQSHTSYMVYVSFSLSHCTFS